MGDVTEGHAMSDAYSGALPIQLDVGYKVIPELLVGGYLSYGPAFVASDACPNGVDCSASQFRVGLQGQYHLSPAGSIDPWLGLGIGWENLATSSTALGVTTDSSVSGYEFLNLQGGADFKLTDAVKLGPFVNFSLGQYSTAPAGDVSADIPNTAMHQWLTIGVKGNYDL
jgi:hypothetical protein